MLNAKAFANAVTAVAAIFYIACWLLSLLAPDLIFSISQSWLHTINLEGLKTTAAMSFGTAILGLISLSLLAWVTTYVTIWLYNKWAGK